MVTERARQLLSSVLQKGVAQGEFRPIDIEYTARGMLNALDHELVLAHSFDRELRDDFDPHRYVDALLQLIVGGTTEERSA